MLPIKPDKMVKPFSQNGDKNTIQDTNDESLGYASLDGGFPPITEQPLLEGGLPPQRKDFNGIFYMLSMFAFWQQSGGLFPYDAALDYNTPAMVLHENMLWYCKKANGPSVGGAKAPGSDAAYWVNLPDFLDVYQKAAIDKIVADLTNKVNVAIANIVSAVSRSFTIAAGQSVSFTAPMNVKSIAVICVTNFSMNPDGGSWGTNWVAITGCPEMSMSANVQKSGSRGHYWGQTVSRAAGSTFNVNIAKGATITIGTRRQGNIGVSQTIVHVTMS